MEHIRHQLEIEEVHALVVPASLQPDVVYVQRVLGKCGADSGGEDEDEVLYDLNH